jgi:predicted SAM-dependent methyltransferase
MNSPPQNPPEPVRLHLGGVEPRPGWKILNIQPGPNVDFVGNCFDLSRFADNAVAEVYASHVLEHLAYAGELPRALKEIYRVLQPGGMFAFSVPDLEILCKLFLDPQLTPQERFHVSRMIYGGQIDADDFHKCPFTWEFALAYLGDAGFKKARRVQVFNVFNDTNSLRYRGVLISLNILTSRDS